MTETDVGSAKPPQISEMFQKFALAFKTKTIEFFAEDEEQDESDPFTLLDSAEEFITDQRVVVLKPDSAQSKPTPTPIPKHIHQTLLSSLFATISSFQASYLQLQTSHSPFDAIAIQAADRALVSHLHKLSEIKNYYVDLRKTSNPNCTCNLLIGSPLEAQVQENQSLLRTFELLFNRLQSEIDEKDAQVLVMKQKLKAIQESNSKLSKTLSSTATFNSTSSSSSSSSSDAFLTVRVFDAALRFACTSTHKFTKVLIDLMKKVRWDLDSASNSVHPGVEYTKISHNRYAFLSYVCLGMFEGFDLEWFGLDGQGLECNWDDSRRSSSLRQFIEHGMGDAMEILSKNPIGCFARFCENKYQQLIHPTMESSLFKDLDQKELILSSWRSSAIFYESFVEMASSIWMLHKLAFSFDPTVEIFQVDRGVDFSMVYMESVTGKGGTPGKTRAKVGFTVVPGFKVGKTVVQSKVYLIDSKSKE